MKKTTIENLEVLINEGEPGQPAIILLHGYGANCEDLYPLSDYLKTKSPMTWIFPNAPVSLPMYYGSRAWFEIDMMELQQSLMTGKHRYFADKIPSGLINASEQIQKMMKVVKKDFGNFYIGGFSQGAMVATDAVLHSDENPLGLILMSGAFVAEERWKKRLPLHKNLKIFQDHGESDPVLSFSEAKRLSELFLANGNSLQFLPFGGGHEIPPPVLKQLQQFLL